MIKRVTDIYSLSGVNSPLFPLIYADFKYSVSESDGIFIQEIDGKITFACSLKGDSLTCIKIDGRYDSEELLSFISFWRVTDIVSDFHIQDIDMKKCALMECKPETGGVSDVKELSSMSALGDYESVFSLISKGNSSFENWFPVLSRKINNGDALGVYYIENNLAVSTTIAPYIYDETAVIAGVYTKSEYRKQGFATHCVNALINQCNERNISKVYLWCEEDKIKFYNNSGFTVCGEIYVKEEK